MKNLLLIRNLLSKSLVKNVAILCVGVWFGWTVKGIYLNIQALTCNDYSTKHAMWRGFLSTKNGEMRCFWLEDKYPWRVRQGVTE